MGRFARRALEPKEVSRRPGAILGARWPPPRTSTFPVPPRPPTCRAQPRPPRAPRRSRARLRALRRPFDEIDPATWDALAAASPWATPFARWAVHRAWWDAYGANAHEQTLVVVDPSAADPEAPVAIVPLMHRHEVEPDDAILRTRLRIDPHLPQTPVEPTAKAVFFGASYHVDYATILARAGRPAGGGRGPGRRARDAGRRRRSRPPRAVGRRGPPPPPLRRSRPRTPSPRRSAPGPATAGRSSGSARRSARS